ncbi:MAG: PqqD family protein [Chloroflexi bacterium]|nr:PqqD family protein [Chloroflexota bacterium]
MQLNDVPAHAPGVVSRLIDGEAVIVHPRQGVVRVLNGVGSRLWELADGRRSAAELAEAITREYEVDGARASAETLAFLTDLAERDLVVVSGRQTE